MPIIKIELEGMRHCVAHAFNQQMIETDAMFQEALELACDPKALQIQINSKVSYELKHLIEEEIKSFFHFGEGQKIIREKVKERLEAELPTPTE